MGFWEWGGIYLNFRRFCAGIGLVDGWIDGYKDTRIHGYMDTWIHGYTARSHGKTNKRERGVWLSHQWDGFTCSIEKNQQADHCFFGTVFSELAREKMWSRIHLIPMLQAEEDRDLVRRTWADKARERELLGGETRVYHSDRWVC